MGGKRQGDRIPESLWQLAAKLVAVHGLARTATTLKLDYYSLKKHAESVGAELLVANAPTFVELPAPLAATGECVIEFEHVSGARMRVHLKGYNMPDLAALGRSFWNAE